MLTSFSLFTYSTVHSHDRYVGVADEASHLQAKAKLAFRWEITINDESHQCDIFVRADHASERVVPFPDAWRTELKIDAAQPAVDVDALAREACRCAREELPLPDVTQLHCRLACAQFTCALRTPV